MLQLAIPVPNVPGTQDIEIEMSMNGYKNKLRYRIEVFPWSDPRFINKDRVECIRDLIKEYDDEWVIYNIGQPTEEFVPLTFINKEDWATQMHWLWSSGEFV